jgi:glutamate racemase
LLKRLLERVMGPEVRLVDSAAETASAVRRELESNGLLAPAGGQAFRRFVVSDDEPHFRRVGERFLGEQLQEVELVPL